MRSGNKQKKTTKEGRDNSYISVFKANFFEVMKKLAIT